MTRVTTLLHSATTGSNGSDTNPMLKLYRIYDHTTQNTIANAIPTEAQAQEVLHFLQQDAPANTLEIEQYTQSTVKPGFGRDPDLH